MPEIEGNDCMSKLTSIEDVPLVEFMYLVFTRMPGENYRRQLRSLLMYLCYVFRALINSLCVVFYLDKGDYSENLHVVLCPNK